MSSAKKTRSGASSKTGTTKRPSVKTRSAAGPTPEQRIAELESQLADTQLHLAAVNRKLESASSELQTSSAKLRDSEEITRSTLDALKASLDREKLALAFAEIGTCEFDVKSSMVRSSDMSLRLLGIRSDQPNLPYDTLLESLHPEDRIKFSHALEQCLSGTGNLDVEYRVAWADGSFRWLRTKGDALLDLDGDPIKVLWVTEDVSQRKDMDARVRFLAHHDLLTGLPNRTLFQDRLQQALAAAKRMQSRVALLFIDLDRFKYVNDSFGHRAGDILLQTVAARLRGCVRETDTVCRHAGDEYLIVLSALREPTEAALVAEKVLAIFDEVFVLESHEIQISASIGISVYPDDGQTLEDLIRNADAAMYHSKKSGRNRFEFFTPELNAPVAERLVLANQLRRAIENNQLVLHYQPQFDTATNGLIGAEALVRWNHTDHGLLFPDSFIALAEESDIIHLIGEWVLNEACRQIAEWQARNLNIVPVAINFSAFQFRRSSLVQGVASAFSRHGVKPQQLEIELTENAIMQDPKETAKTLDQLHEMGVSLSIDDFGTGYSSLNYLKRFPIDKLKIDRSFVEDLPQDLNDSAIVQAIINLAKSLRMVVIAEGVETKAQLDFLRSLSCEAYQGYLGGRPVDAERFAALLK
ncbi:MAG: EAL domain-containing protein [Betaproteobacteria bacterium]|nr:EAL domain-containing protein [Betaproteobacteria bacterium]